MRQEALERSRYARKLKSKSLHNISLIGNCQASALAAVLRRSKHIKCSNLVDVNLMGSQSYAGEVFSLYGCDNHVLSQSMSDEFNEVSWTKLTEKFREKLIGYTNIYFSGLHPDLTYFGKRGLRVVGPLGDYHSRIVLAGFLQGRSPDECRAAFGCKTYDSLGYFSHFVDSAAELKRRDETNQIKFSSHFVELTQSFLTMLSVNHPALITIVELARMMEAFFSDKCSVLTASVCSYPLATGPVWPLYPEIREHNQLPYETAFLFYPQEGAGPALTLEEFVLASYASYEKQGRDVLASVDSNNYYADLPIN